MVFHSDLRFERHFGGGRMTKSEVVKMFYKLDMASYYGTRIIENEDSDGQKEE